MLAKLAFALHDEALVRLLGATPSRDTILERVRALEAEPAPAPGGSGDSPARRAKA